MRYFILIFFGFLTIFSSAEDFSISTTSGTTKGVIKNNVVLWEDIPYAQPPVGDLRWKAPRKISNNNEIIQPKTNNFCIQRNSSFGGSSDFSDELISGSEDCLYLDIFAPKKKSKELLAVMFWIHGGGNTSGLKDLYDFSKLVRKHNIILVRINYRLGPFGFFTHPAIQDLQNGLDKSSNYGTLDIISALEWVNENIYKFGGDPNNITIFGESAGGHNVLSLLVSKKAKGLFHKAISMSGYTESISSDNAYRQNTYSFTSKHTSWNIVNEIFKTKTDSKKYDQNNKTEIRDLLLGMSGKEFYSYYFDRENYEEIPLLTNDGFVIPKIGLRDALSKSEYVNKVPTIIGSNRDEVKFWLAFSQYLVSVDYSFSSSIFNLPKIVIKDKDAYEAFNYYRSSAWKVRGVDEPLNFLIKAGNNNLYSYRFDWDDQRRFFIANFKELFGATHALEIPLLAGDTALVGGPPVSNFIYPKGFSKFYVSRNMMRFWANFAKNGYPGNSTNNIEWEQYSKNNSNTKSYIILDKKNNLKMSSNMTSLKKLSEKLFDDERLNSIEKCVVLYQMFTFVGNDLYDENIVNYPGDCNRKDSIKFITTNASTVEYN